jgi:hypothetical protein
MKAIRWIAWISAAIAVVIIILAGVALISGKLIHGIEHGVNYFHIANSFLLLAIAMFIVTRNYSLCSDKKEGQQ